MTPRSPIASRCLICGGEFTSTPFAVAEAMFGTGESFDYLECPLCGSLRIAEPPQDLSRYYQGGYYSFGSADQGGLKAAIRRTRDRAYFGGGGILGAALRLAKPDRLMSTFAAAGFAPGRRIVDVGSGSGRNLERLRQAGFGSLVGLDPFLETDAATPSGVPLHKRYLGEWDREADIVMFNHSLEHVPDPAAELREAARVLGPGGTCLVRIPTPSGQAWETYREGWVQLDAPRHVALPSRDGMRRLAERAGFRVAQAIDDGWSFAFWGSELARIDGRLGADPRARFGAARMRDWQRQAEQLNVQGRGDQCAFVLRKA